MTNPTVTGLYENINMDKQGFDLLVSSHGTYFYWYTFDKDGLPIYYIGGGGGNSFRLWVTDGNRDEHEIGECTFTPTMVMAYTQEMGRVTIPVTPIVLTSHSHDDAWVDDRNGADGKPLYPAEGFTIHFWNNLCSALWFTYKNGRPWWYVCPGVRQPTNSDVYDLSIIEIENGRFMYGGGDENEVGTARLEIVDDDSITIAGALGNNFLLSRLF